MLLALFSLCHRNHDAPIYQRVMSPSSPEMDQIGNLIATNLVKDGATLQMGNSHQKHTHIISSEGWCYSTNG